MWCIPKLDEEYIERMMDVLEVYERPYDGEYPVVCLDEKSKQLLGRKREALAMKPGKDKREDYEYKRYGTANVFVAVEPKGGKRKVKTTRRRTKKDFAFMLEELVQKSYKRAKQIVLITDNLNTHTEAAIIDTLGEERGRVLLNRIEWHYTPKHASWLNMAEIEIGVLDRQCLNKEMENIEAMRQEVRAWEKRRNEKKAMIQWQFTREKAQEKFKLSHTGKLTE
jgi:transposase